MKATLSPGRVWLVGLVCLGAACGCGPSVKLVPVSGKVSVDGQPLTAGQVSLVPQTESKDQKTAGLSAGTIDSSGNYKIMTNGKDGAPLGKYKVVVAPSMMPSEAGKIRMDFNSRYSDPKNTDLQYEVVANPSATQYDLSLKK
jgi:hypothetical protein